MSKDFYQAQQPSALSFHFYYHCFEGTLGFHKTCILLPVASSLLPFLRNGSSTCASLSAIWDQNCSSRTQAAWLKRRSQHSQQSALRTLSTREPGRAHARLWERRRSVLWALPNCQACSGPQSTGKTYVNNY